MKEQVNCSFRIKHSSIHDRALSYFACFACEQSISHEKNECNLILFNNATHFFSVNTLKHTKSKLGVTVCISILFKLEKFLMLSVTDMRAVCQRLRFLIHIENISTMKMQTFLLLLFELDGSILCYVHRSKCPLVHQKMYLRKFKRFRQKVTRKDFFCFSYVIWRNVNNQMNTRTI